MAQRFDNKSRKKLGLYFKKCRTNSGLTQTQVARQLSLSGSQYISNIERGLAFFTSDQLKVVSRLYKLNRYEVTQLVANELVSSFEREMLIIEEDAVEPTSAKSSSNLRHLPINRAVH